MPTRPEHRDPGSPRPCRLLGKLPITPLATALPRRRLGEGPPLSSSLSTPFSACFLPFDWVEGQFLGGPGSLDQHLGQLPHAVLIKMSRATSEALAVQKKMFGGAWAGHTNDPWCVGGRPSSLHQMESIQSMISRSTIKKRNRVNICDER